MFYVPEGKGTFFRITGGEQEMVRCEAETTVIIPPNAVRALFASCRFELFLDSIQSSGRIVGYPSRSMQSAEITSYKPTRYLS
jgi:hypothetical protein